LEKLFAAQEGFTYSGSAILSGVEIVEYPFVHVAVFGFEFQVTVNVVLIG